MSCLRPVTILVAKLLLLLQLMKQLSHVFMQLASDPPQYPSIGVVQQLSFSLADKYVYSWLLLVVMGVLQT